MFENKDTIKLIINIINKQNIDIDDIYDALNIGKKHTGYITNENSSDDESFYGYIDDDDKSFYSDDYYNDDDLLEYYHNQSQYKKCGYENDTNNCIHDCKGLIYKDDDNEYIIRFRYRLLSSKSFENNYWYFYLENKHWWY